MASEQHIIKSINKTFVKLFFIFWYVAAVLFFILGTTIESGYEGKLIQSIPVALLIAYITFIALPVLFLVFFLGSALFMYDLRSYHEGKSEAGRYVSDTVVSMAWNYFPIYQLIKYWGTPGFRVLLVTTLADFSAFFLLGGLMVAIFSTTIASIMVGVSFILMIITLFIGRKILLAMVNDVF